MIQLTKIQNELKAKKSQFNNFGKYYYRSCEDILEAIKPLLEKYDCACYISDEIFETAQSVYIKATAKFIDIANGKESIESTAYAREPKTKKGMDDSQITGATSSYARKYALNALFLIDDSKDADSDGDTADPERNPVHDAIKKAQACNTTEQLQSVWNQYTDTMQKNPSVLKAVNAHKTKLQGGQ